MDIVHAASGAALEEMLALAQEYVDWLREEVKLRLPDIDSDLFTAEHAYDNMRAKFPGTHILPDGGLWVARVEDKGAGCVALGRLDDHTAELRTMYVRPDYRGLGIGKRLLETALAEARALHYTQVRLDTLSFLDDAQRLYRAYGFYAIEPYIDLPPSIKPHIRFYEYQLA
jgi:GNAT superfamily N-acetyltransferase